MAIRKRRESSQNTAVESDAPTTENISIFEEGANNLFSVSVDTGHKVDSRAQKIFVLAVVLLVIYFFCLIVPKNMLDPAHEINFGPYTLSGFIAELQGNVEHLIGVFTGQDDLWTQSYLGSMLRQMVVALAGAGLALCGAVYQGAFRNALLAPSTLGVMSGAQFGLMIWVVLFGVTTDRPWFRKFFTEVDHVQATFITEHKFYVQAEGVDTGLYYLWDSLSLALFSFAGCVLVVALVLLTMRLSKRVRTSAIMLIITGQMIGGVTGAVYSTVRYYYIVTDPWGMKAGLLTELQISSFYRNFSWIDIVCIGLPLLVTFLVVMKLRQKMMLLSFDEGESRTMGTDVRRMQIIIVGLCTLLTAIIVSFCGAVGFVGFLVPHLTRRLVGPNFRYLLPATTVFGAVFVLGAYMLLAMTMGTGYQTMLGMYISIGGAIIFLATALRGKGVAYGGFR